MSFLDEVLAIASGLMKHGVDEKQATKMAKDFVSGNSPLKHLDKAGQIPAETITDYKLFRDTRNVDQLMLPTQSTAEQASRLPTQVSPLYVNRNDIIPINEWDFAKMGEMVPGKDGKVKSSLGPLAFRPGYHTGKLPGTSHIGSSAIPKPIDPKTGKKTDVPPEFKYRTPDQVWAEVSIPSDAATNWTDEALSRASIVKSKDSKNYGKPNPSEAHITDQLPYGGSYPYNTSGNVQGEWSIAPAMRVDKILTPAEVRDINAAAKWSDLPYLDEVVAMHGLKKADMTKSALDDMKRYYPEMLAKMKSVTGIGLTAGVAGGAALTSEDAEASPFGDVANTADRMLKLGMISPDTLKNPSAVKSAITRYNKYLKESKAFREREHMAAAADDFVNFQQTDLGGRIVADLEKMIGKPIMPVRGDKSDIGTIVSANGIDINTPVQGGSKFSQANTDADRGWMSMYGVAKGVQSKIMKIADDLGVEPIAIYNAMGRDSVNFSTPVAEAMFKQLDELPIAKADIKEFDAAMRKAYPKWVGLKSENAMDQLMGVGDFPMEGAGKMRTAFSVLMGQDKFQKRGFPSYDKIVDAITDPALRDVEKGGSGLSMYQTTANPIFRELGVHKSYDAVMPGNYIGGLPDDRSIPFEVMFPEVFNKMSKMTDKHGNPLSRDLIINTANMSGEGWQIADDAWFDGIQKYLKENPKSVGTGSAILGALSGNAMAGTDVPDYAMPMAVQAAGQSDLSGKANPGREVGTVLAGLDMLLPLVGEAFKPATMGNAELTDEIRKRGYYGM